ncbi:hypothetical protein [Thalassospira lucentensis]|uniref:hypothetical protein n=1 Tax=Thalassospira lucentensis TaxID=168935 RepID=UPI002943859A|nr:hypothetical protein [Thalassospira lucentensis]WOI09080.1 hypothetical protein R1T41_00365 [Thalassospira lucentensis]
MPTPVLVCGYLPHAEETVAQRVEDAPDWREAVRSVKRPFAGEMMFVVALDDQSRRSPEGVWENLPLVETRWTRKELTDRFPFTIIGFNNMSMEPLMLHVEGGNWIIAAQCVVAERNQEGFHFVAAFEGFIPQSDVLGSFTVVDRDTFGDAA